MLLRIIFFFFNFQVIHDVRFLAREVCGDYLGLVLRLLSSCSAEVRDSVKDSILQGGKSLNDIVPSIINTIVEALVEKSVEVPCLIFVFRST